MSEQVQLDMVCGLLNHKIREKIPRDKCTSFAELLTQARLVEECLTETKVKSSVSTNLSSEDQDKKNLRYSY